MKCVTIKSAVELLDKLQLPNGLHIYRGQGKRGRWLLHPSIARLPSDFLNGYDSWDGVQDNFLSNFKRLSLPYLETKPQNDIEWLILARHYGIPTNILDWTTNPLKALFFAVENLEQDKFDGVVWNLEVSGYYKDRDLTELIKSKRGKKGFLVCYLPPHDNPRVVAQESILTFFPFPNSYKPIPPLENRKNYKKDIITLEEFVIPKENKEICRKELLNLGISHMSLFPDLEGVAKTILRELDLPW
jgi:hypothetical protein